MGVWVIMDDMKTTIEIADDLLIRAKQLARDQGTTLRSLTEEGLRKVIAEREAPKKFKFRPVVFKGKGFTPEFQNANWEQIRDEIYKGRGA